MTGPPCLWDDSFPVWRFVLVAGREQRDHPVAVVLARPDEMAPNKGDYDSVRAPAPTGQRPPN